MGQRGQEVGPPGRAGVRRVTASLAAAQRARVPLGDKQGAAAEAMGGRAASTRGKTGGRGWEFLGRRPPELGLWEQEERAVRGAGSGPRLWEEEKEGNGVSFPGRLGRGRGGESVGLSVCKCVGGWREHKGMYGSPHLGACGYDCVRMCAHMCVHWWEAWLAASPCVIEAKGGSLVGFKSGPCYF